MMPASSLLLLILLLAAGPSGAQADAEGNQAALRGRLQAPPASYPQDEKAEGDEQNRRQPSDRRQPDTRPFADLEDDPIQLQAQALSVVGVHEEAQRERRLGQRCELDTTLLDAPTPTRKPIDRPTGERNIDDGRLRQHPRVLV